MARIRDTAACYRGRFGAVLQIVQMDFLASTAGRFIRVFSVGGHLLQRWNTRWLSRPNERSQHESFAELLLRAYWASHEREL